MQNRYPRMADRIVVEPTILAGKPIIVGTRIPVVLILNLLASGYDVTRIISAYLNLTDEDIRAAIGYAAERLACEELRPFSVT